MSHKQKSKKEIINIHNCITIKYEPLNTLKYMQTKPNQKEKGLIIFNEVEQIKSF
jgi:hypothetical protein